MALSGDTLTAVIAGSTVGVIVFLSIIASILYCCVRRRRILQKSEKAFNHRHLTPDTSLSKNSGPPQQKHGDPRVLADPRLDPRIDPRLDTRIDPRLDARVDPRQDPRLPKVGSKGLWFGAPSLYSAAPSQAYNDMKRKPNTRPVEQPGLPGVPPGGHMIYQGANMSRIYHSQQVVPSMYDAEYRIPRSGSYMDLYSYPYNYDPYRDMNNMNNSRAMLVSYQEQEEYYVDRYREREVRRTGKKVRRSQSDVTLHSTRRPKNRKQRKEAPFDRQSQDSAENRGQEVQRRSQSNDRELQRDRTTVADVHKPKKPAPLPPKQTREETQTQSKKFSEPEITESATDSAKLRALERERERNRENERDAQKRIDDCIYKSDYIRDNQGFIDDNGMTSDLNVRPYNYVGKPAMYESSAVAKMAALADTPKATYITRQSISGNIKETPTTKEAFHAEVSKKLEKLQDVNVPPLDITDGPVATSTGNHSRSSRPQSAKGRRRSRRGSNVTDQDGNIVTQEAFEFLDGYSDGEGTDFIGSGSITPTLVRDYDVNL